MPLQYNFRKDIVRRLVKILRRSHCKNIAEQATQKILRSRQTEILRSNIEAKYK